MRGKRVAESRVKYEYEAIPTDANSAGNVHGGVIMKIIDSTAGVVAKKHSRPHAFNVVTALIDNIEFLSPAHIGNLLHFEAFINFARKTSMEVEVRVDVEDLKTGKKNHVSTSYVTFVALDDSNRPTEIPVILPRTKLEKQRYEEGKKRAEIRKQRRNVK